MGSTQHIAHQSFVELHTNTLWAVAFGGNKKNDTFFPIQANVMFSLTSFDEEADLRSLSLLFI